MPKVTVRGWITPEGYSGRALRGEVLSRAMRVDLEVDLPRGVMLVKVGDQLVLTVEEE